MNKIGDIVPQLTCCILQECPQWDVHSYCNYTSVGPTGRPYAKYK